MKKHVCNPGLLDVNERFAPTSATGVISIGAVSSTCQLLLEKVVYRLEQTPYPLQDAGVLGSRPRESQCR